MATHIRLLFLAVILFLSASAGKAESQVTEMIPIPLRQGVNNISSFADDGRDALIVLGWRDNGNAHGYDVFLVMLPTSKGGHDWNVVLGPDGKEIIVDQPHVGEDMVRSIRFVRAKLDGVPRTLLVTATRDVRNSYSDPSPALIEFFHLARQTEPGTTYDYFERIREFRTARYYCNAEYALKTELGLPTRQQFDGFDEATGCMN